MEAQMNTWDSIKVDGVDTIYYYGSDKTELKGNILEVDSPDTLDYVYVKTLKAFNYFKDSGYDFIFRTNSSSYIDKQMLKDYVIKHFSESTTLYAGVYDGCLASGAGFLITTDLIDYLNDDGAYYGQIDDIEIGVSLHIKRKQPIISLPRCEWIPAGEPLPSDYFHYRCKPNDSNRRLDVDYMNRIHEIKGYK
jgi:hypothetical protein